MSTRRPLQRLARMLAVCVLCEASSGCSSESCEHDGYLVLQAGRGDSTDELPACDEWSDPPGQFLLTVQKVVHRSPCSTEYPPQSCLTLVDGTTRDWGPECMARFGTAAPYYLAFEVGQEVQVNYRRVLSDVDGWETGVVRDAATGSLLAGASFGAHAETFESFWFGDMTFEAGEEVCSERKEIVFKTPQGERCRVQPDEPRTCTLWGEQYNVRGNAPPATFIITRTDVIVPPP